MKFYAVAIGRTIGVFETWDETKPLVNGYSGARHKSFKSRKEAQDFVDQNRIESEATVERISFEEPEKVPEWTRNSSRPGSGHSRHDSGISMGDGVSGEWLLHLQRKSEH